MKRARSLAWSVCLLGASWATAIHAQQQPVQPRPADFAMQLPLKVSGENGVVQLRLPLMVYEQARSPDLADVRVFNGASEPVPFAFLELGPSERVSWREDSARLFPIYGPATVTLATHTELEVRIAANGALVSVRSKGGVAKPDELTALILDLGPARGGELLDSLQLLPGTAGSYRAELAIDRSDDLKLWDRVAQSRVDWLRGSAEAELVNDRIAMSGQGGRYLRIQWLEGAPQMFERITARWRSTESVTEAPLEVRLEPSPGKIAGDLVYAAGPSMAASQVGLDLPTPNSVVPASIGFYRELRPPPRSVFISIVNGTFYRLNQNGMERTSSRVQIAPQASSQWVVRAQDLGAATPALVLRWHPSTLVFTASGAAGSERNQFILAVGAIPALISKWRSSQAAIDLVAPGFSQMELREAERAVAGQWRRSAQAPAPEKTPAARTSVLENRSLVLWAVLIVGALVLAAMSWRLYRQMEKEPR